MRGETMKPMPGMTVWYYLGDLKRPYVGLILEVKDDWTCLLRIFNRAENQTIVLKDFNKMVPYHEQPHELCWGWPQIEVEESEIKNENDGVIH